MTIHSENRHYGTIELEVDECGWYWDDVSMSRTSVYYKSKSEALEAYRNTQIAWEGE